jgi:hypothetical protein
MVKSRRDLNQRLQKRLLRLLQTQPDALPMLVGKPELLIPITAHALCKRGGLPVESHNFSLGDLHDE